VKRAAKASKQTARVQLSTPAGLKKRQTFRFVFVTANIIPPISPNVADYDLFVNGEALGATYNGKKVNWQAIVSTSSVDAIVHIGSNKLTGGIFMVNGAPVAKDTTTSPGGLWSGKIVNPIGIGINGATPPVPTTSTWTGTTASGVKSNDGSGKGPLGTGNYSFGDKAANGPHWVQGGFYSSPFKFQLYGISEILTVV
jgi:hypothetical protein